MLVPSNVLCEGTVPRSAVSRSRSSCSASRSDGSIAFLLGFLFGESCCLVSRLLVLEILVGLCFGVGRAHGLPGADDRASDQG